MPSKIKNIDEVWAIWIALPVPILVVLSMNSPIRIENITAATTIPSAMAVPTELEIPAAVATEAVSTIAPDIAIPSPTINFLKCGEEGL
ncbi:hypothetical protein CDZ98_09310 [Mameliella alba]|nr:hypothetical protein CDZ98_09310 [Mameliella alba]